MTTAAALTAAIRDEAARLGFELAGVAPAVTPVGIHEFLNWLERGCAGEMHYLPGRVEAYQHPRHVLEGVRSIVMLALNYNQPDPAADEAASTLPIPGAPARIARYARGTRDYHDLIRERLNALGESVARIEPGARTRGVVDTAPLLERDFARLAGLGWFGKNTMLINKRLGSWFFLAAFLTDQELVYDQPHETSHCGTCTRCLDACPTGAFVGPYVLDARKCISYLTIEHRGPIPVELREGIGDWLFGCDVCQDVCPWNRKAPPTRVSEFAPHPDMAAADAVELLSLTPEEFRTRFRLTPLARPKRAGLLRNATIVLGNRPDPLTIPALIRALEDPEPLVRGGACWALGRFSDPEARQALQRLRSIEDDPAVRQELDAALSLIQEQDSLTCLN